MCPLCAATTSALVPIAAVSFTSAPAATRCPAISRLPCRAANRMGVLLPSTVSITPVGLNPAVRVWMRRGCGAERACTSAPSPTSVSTISECSWATAHISAVWPLVCSRAFRSAPWDARRRTASADPVRDAVISTVSPEGRAAFASAPAASRVSTIASLPFRQASQSGFTPKSFVASMAAPAPRRASAIAVSSQWAAQCRAVAPSACRAFAETPCSSRAITRVASAPRAASSSRVSWPAAAPPAGASSSPTRSVDPASLFACTLFFLHGAVSTGPRDALVPGVDGRPSRVRISYRSMRRLVEDAETVEDMEDRPCDA